MTLKLRIIAGILLSLGQLIIIWLGILHNDAGLEVLGCLALGTAVLFTLTLTRDYQTIEIQQTHIKMLKKALTEADDWGHDQRTQVALLEKAIKLYVERDNNPEP